MKKITVKKFNLNYPEKSLSTAFLFGFALTLVPNVVIALRIFLSLPVSVAEAKRKFSGQKIIKSAHRNFTKQETYNAESTVYHNFDLITDEDLNAVMDNFVDKKVRKKFMRK